jgi:hypothetical protein
MKYGYTTKTGNIISDTWWLHDMGQDGWKLCSIVPLKNGDYKYYFVREIKDNP